MFRAPEPVFSFFVAVVLSISLIGCTGVSTSSSSSKLTVSPALASVPPGGTVQFSAIRAGVQQTNVNWFVDGVQNGNAVYGTISGAGLYTAPSTPPNTNISVTATSTADVANSASATVQLSSSTSTIAIAISPVTQTIQLGGTQQFTATITGATNTGAKWLVNGIQGGNSSVGSVTNTGTYRAPSSMPAGGSVVVMAQSSADSSKSASATVTLTSQTPAITVSISPLTPALQLGGTQQFAANVTGTSNTAVTWSVNGVQNGNSTYGTISNAGLYTSPSTLPSGGSVEVKAQSVADTSKSASTAVTLSSSSTVSVTISPSTATLAGDTSTQFTATVSGASNTGVSWSVNNVLGGNSTYGTISSSGQYNAPACPSVSNVTVTAQSVYDTAASASAAVSLKPGVLVQNRRHVATNGSDSNDGSGCHPWATIQHADSLAQPGWIISVAAGTYKVGSDIVTHSSGNASARIVFLGEGYDKATWTWPVKIVSTGTSVWNTSGQYEDIQGFDMTSTSTSATWGIHGQAAYDRYIDNYIHNIYSDSPGAAVMIGGGADHQQVIGNVIAHVGHTMGGSTDNQGIYVQENYTSVLNNVLFDCHKVCIQIWSGAASGKPQYNVVSGNTVFGSYRGFDIGAANSAFADYNVITNNIFYDNADLGMYTTSGAQTYVGSHNTIAYNNSWGNPTGNYYNLTYTNPINNDPLFVNYQANGTGNYHLLPGSSCNGTGTSNGAPTYDFLYASRSSTSEDCGAYAYVP